MRRVSNNTSAATMREEVANVFVRIGDLICLSMTICTFSMNLKYHIDELSHPSCLCSVAVTTFMKEKELGQDPNTITSFTYNVDYKAPGGPRISARPHTREVSDQTTSQVD